MKRMLLCLLALLPLTGCEALPFARELEETMLVQVLGVDWDGAGVTLTAVSDPGEDGGEDREEILSASGRDMGEAEAALRGMGEKYVSLTHVTQLVVGAGSDLSAVLDAALQEPALGQGATVWVAADSTAKSLLERAGGGAKRLSSIELNSDVSPVTVLQGLMRLEENGRVELPTLAVKKGALISAGTEVFLGEYHGT